MDTTPTNHPQSFRELSLRCHSFESFFSTLRVSQQASVWIRCLSPEWNWIPRSITTSAESANGAQHTVCCVVARIPHPALSAPLGRRCCWTLTWMRWHSALLRREIDCCHAGHHHSWHQKGQDQSSHLFGLRSKTKGRWRNFYIFRACFEVM